MAAGSRCVMGSLGCNMSSRAIPGIAGVDPWTMDIDKRAQTGFSASRRWYGVSKSQWVASSRHFPLNPNGNAEGTAERFRARVDIAGSELVDGLTTESCLFHQVI
jgi:hypothetical protein